MKRCTKCDIEKPLDDFYSSKTNLDGHHKAQVRSDDL